MAKYTCLLFDLDDTLLDFKQASRTAFRLFYERYLLDSGLTPETAFEHYHDANLMVWEMFEQNQISIDELKTRRFEWMYQHAGLSIPFDELPAQSDFFLDALIESTHLLEGAEPLLTHLSSQYHLSVITNGISYVQHSRLKRLNIGHHFQHVFISEEIGHSKPSEGFFNHVLDTLMDHPPQNMLVIGDSLNADIAGALQAGLDACWFNPHGLTHSGKHAPNYEIRSWQEFTSLLS